MSFSHTGEENKHQVVATYVHPHSCVTHFFSASTSANICFYSSYYSLTVTFYTLFCLCISLSFYIFCAWQCTVASSSPEGKSSPHCITPPTLSVTGERWIRDQKGLFSLLSFCQVIFTQRPSGSAQCHTHQLHMAAFFISVNCLIQLYWYWNVAIKPDDGRHRDLTDRPTMVLPPSYDSSLTKSRDLDYLHSNKWRRNQEKIIIKITFYIVYLAKALSPLTWLRFSTQLFY